MDSEFLSPCQEGWVTPCRRLHKSSGRVGELQRTEEEMDMTPWLGVLFFVGCLSISAFGQPVHGTLEKIKSTNTITMGYRETSLPFSYVGDEKKPVGYTVDLCTRVAADIQQQLSLNDLRVKWTPVTPENRMAMVANGTIDLECGSTTNTLSRQEQVDFSQMIFVDGGSLLVSIASNIKSLSDIAGKRVAVIPGTTTENVLAEALEKANIEVDLVRVREHSDGIAALENGSADAYASDRVILIGLALASKDLTKLALAEQYLSYEPYGLMLRRGDADFRLAVNRVLSRLYRSGQIYPIYERWFGAVDRASPLLQTMYRLNGLPE
jgi:glutamate/aspartate transport system substrate-binding protein